ncbi:beta-fructosidase, partial [Clostridium perfringens]
TPDDKFVNDHPAGKVLTTDYGKEYYASMSFSDLPDSRRIMLAWMTNWDYPFAFPTQGWKGALSIPRELTLRQTEEGPRLFQAPIRELTSLGRELFSVKNRLVTPKEANLLQGLSSGAYELEALIEIPEGSAVKEFGFRLREGAEQKTVAGYKVAEKLMFVDRSKSGNTDFSPLFSTFHT